MQSKITLRFHLLQSELLKNKKATNADENVGEREPPLLLLGLYPGAAN